MNHFLLEVGDEAGKTMSNLEVALGFIDVANEAMCRPIRALTQVGCWNSQALTHCMMILNVL